MLLVLRVALLLAMVSFGFLLLAPLALFIGWLGWRRGAASRTSLSLSLRRPDGHYLGLVPMLSVLSRWLLRSAGSVGLSEVFLFAVFILLLACALLRLFLLGVSG
jgi:hypothetical protein